MKIKKIQLDHWCQHTSLCLTLPDAPIVRISGPNNIGKSNLIRAVGRALAQGRSDYGDASDIQYGAKQAEIILDMETADRTAFTISRVIKEKQSKATLLIPGTDPITASDEIQKMLTQWFGRPETLLSLFIASQGAISRLLKTEGKQRLVEFIEICGFKSFLVKQAAINKLIKSFPVLEDPTLLIKELEAKQASLEAEVRQKKSELNDSQKTELLHQINQLKKRQTLFLQNTEDINSKTEELTKLEASTDKLPDLRQIEQLIKQIEGDVELAAQVQRYNLKVRLEKEIAGLRVELVNNKEDQTDYPALIQQANGTIQANHQQLQAILEVEQQLKTAETELTRLEGLVSTAKGKIKEITVAHAWFQLSSVDLQSVQALKATQATYQAQATKASEQLKEAQNTQPPTQEILKAVQATEGRVQELKSLRSHAEKADKHCPLCAQPWLAQAIKDRISVLEQSIATAESELKLAPAAQVTYQTWLKAQQDLPRLQQALVNAEQNLSTTNLQLDSLLAKLNLPISDLSRLNHIVSTFTVTQNYFTQATTDLSALQALVKTKTAEVDANKTRKASIETVNATAAVSLAKILENQAKAQAAQTSRVRTQAALESKENLLLPVTGTTLPANYRPEVNYEELASIKQQELKQQQQLFRDASASWAAAAEKANQCAVLKKQIASSQQSLIQQAWTEQQEVELGQKEKAIQEITAKEAEVRLLETQIKTLGTEITSYEGNKQAFTKQAIKVADLQAVSNFLSYDNGPQKFLELFFKDTLNQTNLLISEMGLPVSLQLGTNLEIMVLDKNKRLSSSLALGGGYSNLIGIAFRIALQKLVLPKVNTVILDEPSTHVDEANMELLIPFFEKLKGQLHTYGIEQCIIIDHHPAWRNSSVKVIELGSVIV